MLLIDTRNDYEVSIGTFENALNPNIKNFREFPKWVSENLLKKDPEIKNKKIENNWVCVVVSAVWSCFSLFFCFAVFFEITARLSIEKDQLSFFYSWFGLSVIKYKIEFGTIEKELPIEKARAKKPIRVGTILAFFSEGTTSYVRLSYTSPL